jgi:hypothetical protein
MMLLTGMGEGGDEGKRQETRDKEKGKRKKRRFGSFRVSRFAFKGSKFRVQHFAFKRH